MNNIASFNQTTFTKTFVFDKFSPLLLGQSNGKDLSAHVIETAISNFFRALGIKSTGHANELHFLKISKLIRLNHTIFQNLMTQSSPTFSSFESLLSFAYTTLAEYQIEIIIGYIDSLITIDYPSN